MIPAAGQGTRMQSPVAKQYLLLGERAMLVVTLSRFADLPGLQGAVLALGPGDEIATDLLSGFSDFPLHFVQGGETRACSVRAALEYLSALPDCSQDAWVAVHDAARPCVHPADVGRLLMRVAAAGDRAGGLLAAPVRDTLKRSTDLGRVAATVPREQVFHALTPQVFPLDRLMSAMDLARMAGANLTDEASALEFIGAAPLLVEGRADNIKVTHPEDLPLARLILRSQGVLADENAAIDHGGDQSGETCYV
ncbi:2-C-methyl-D-erythritol 4-phosphate cytidylyltransferase [Halothiobacillus diazotrophicus]